MTYVISCVLLTILFYVLAVLLDTKRKENRKLAEPNEEELEALALIVNTQDFYKALNFMLMYGIIDFQEYTKLELKSLPYLKG